MKRVIPFSVARLAAIALLGGIALAGCGGGAETKQNDPHDRADGGTELHGSGARHRGHPGLPHQLLGERPRHESLRQLPQRGRSDAELRTLRRRECRLSAGDRPSSNRDNPSQSTIVIKVGGGHNCWLTDASACATHSHALDHRLGRRDRDRWTRRSSSYLRRRRDPGSSRRFPETAPAGFTGVHNLLTQYCSDCHTSTSATKQSPYFASSDIDEAYLAAIPKINLDLPAESRFVIRLGRESHNCWDNCAANAATMQAAIQAMADGIPVTQVDPGLVVSKALRLVDGTIASGGNRYENNLIALYEFKTGEGSTVFDTSGVDPAADLSLAGQRTVDFDWVGGWGVQFKTPMAKAQASTTASRKFHQLITATGEYSIEAWVVPGNVTQEDARIVSYSGSTTARNFTMGQTLYNYDFFGRSSETGTNGTPALSTDDDDERLQASLQHVVMTFDPVNGRRIYVNGEFTGDLDSESGGTLGDWDNSFAFVLGNEVSSNRPWSGVLRLVAIHNRALNLQQIQQNFEAGVGEQFFLLFGIEHITSIPRSYIMFEAAQYDSAGYLFTNPKFVSLDANARPGSLAAARHAYRRERRRAVRRPGVPSARTSRSPMRTMHRRRARRSRPSARSSVSSTDRCRMSSISASISSAAVRTSARSTRAAFRRPSPIPRALRTSVCARSMPSTRRCLR